MAQRVRVGCVDSVCAMAGGRDCNGHYPGLPIGLCQKRNRERKVWVSSTILLTPSGLTHFKVGLLRLTQPADPGHELLLFVKPGHQDNIYYSITEI